MIFRKKKPLVTLGRVVLFFAVVAFGLLFLAGPGTRFELWDFRFGFQLIQWSLFIALGVAATATVCLVIKKTRQAHSSALLSAMVLAAITASIPYHLYTKAQALPKIHDITTDVNDVPEFVAIAPLRQTAPNPVTYSGTETAQAQKQAYPQIRTYVSDQSPTRVFTQALASAKALDWTVVAADPEQGRIEAFDTTFWFGFVDDVVIRVRSEQDSSYLDVRSKSRVGLSDLGKNAQRIEEFLDHLDANL